MSKVIHKWYYEVAAIHAALRIAAELLGLYIVIVAGTDVLPQWLRFKHWKWWMRTELVLWAIVCSVVWQRTAHGMWRHSASTGSFAIFATCRFGLTVKSATKLQRKARNA